MSLTKQNLLASFAVKIVLYEALIPRIVLSHVFFNRYALQVTCSSKRVFGERKKRFECAASDSVRQLHDCNT